MGVALVIPGRDAVDGRVLLQQVHRLTEVADHRGGGGGGAATVTDMSAIASHPPEEVQRHIQVLFDHDSIFGCLRMGEGVTSVSQPL